MCDWLWMALCLDRSSWRIMLTLEWCWLVQTPTLPMAVAWVQYVLEWVELMPLMSWLESLGSLSVLMLVLNIWHLANVFKFSVWPRFYPLKVSKNVSVCVFPFVEACVHFSIRWLEWGWRDPFLAGPLQRMSSWKWLASWLWRAALELLWSIMDLEWTPSPALVRMKNMARLESLVK